MSSVKELPLYDKALLFVNNSYNRNDKGNIVNTDYIENIWLEENSHISDLGNQVRGIHIFNHTEKKGYSFKNDLMTHILDEMRHPIPSNRGGIMSYLYKNKGWGFDFYIYTPEFIYFTNGIKNEQNKYFNVIPNLE